jgi:hypothetical protein
MSQLVSCSFKICIASYLHFAIAWFHVVEQFAYN